MFASKKDLDSYIKATQWELTQLKEKYWSLRDKHELLLKHLGLSEHTVPEIKELRTKGGPEREA